MNLIIAVDFDGTVVEHDFPRIGRPVPYAQTVLNRLQWEGCKIILWTCRSEKYLDDAVKYMEEIGIKLYGVNENPDSTWNTSPKINADIYIDDKGFGIPLLYRPDTSVKALTRVFVNWRRIGEQLGIFSLEELEGEENDSK